MPTLKNTSGSTAGGDRVSLLRSDHEAAARMVISFLEHRFDCNHAVGWQPESSKRIVALHEEMRNGAVALGVTTKREFDECTTILSLTASGKMTTPAIPAGLWAYFARGSGVDVQLQRPHKNQYGA